MATNRILLVTSLATALAAAPAVHAASLQSVTGWSSGGVPSDVSMYLYVPTNVAATPPVLTLIHYCGGSASAVFGQAQGGGLVSAADKYGFIMVVPDNGGRCWDIESNKAWTRSGGGDSDAIKQMVTFAISKHNGNAGRVYATGDSSGGMMTELLLALYPDIFVGGSAFAGMPAGCRGSNESSTSTGYSGACAGGSVTHTGAQWGTIVDMMDPGYTGRRPRVQLFHGSADTTISPTNFSQAIVEWTDVLGLNSTPTTTTSGVTLGKHQATRQQWQDTCGDVVLDAFLSMGGDHGPSDALFDATYVVPFLGLDQTGAVDPVVAKCGGGTGGRGGASGAAGSAGAGGKGGSGGAGGKGPPVTGTGGSVGTGGHDAAGGSPGSGGTPGTGGVQGTGGAGTGGITASGGAPGSGGTPGTGGGSPAGTGGTTGSGGTETPGDSGSSGCGCATGAGGRGWWATGTLAVLLLGVRRRRRSAVAPRRKTA